jgi:ABC-type anion transport system duplicated permease subunit
VRISIGVFVYVIIGMVVAARHHFLAHLQTVDQFVSAILAVLLWPLVLLGVHAHI